MEEGSRSWFNYFHFDASLHSETSVKRCWSNLGLAMSGVLDPRLHYHLIHEFTHAISSATPAYLCIRMQRLEAMLLFGSFERMHFEGKVAVDLKTLDPNLVETSLARFLAAEYLEAYLSPAFEGIACFAQLNVTPSRKRYQFFRPLKDLFDLMDHNVAAPPWRSRLDPVSTISDRQMLKQEILENPVYRTETRMDLLNQPIQDQEVSGGYLIGYNWINALYPSYQQDLDPEEFIYALIDLFFFDLELSTKAIDVDSIDKANDLDEFLRSHIYRILSGETTIESVLHRRDDLPGFYTCPFMWPGGALASLRYPVSDLEQYGGRMQANLARIHRFMETIQYVNKSALFLTVMADPLITISSAPVTSVIPQTSGCIVEGDSDGEMPFKAELDAFSWKKGSNCETRIYYGLLLRGHDLKEVVGEFCEKDLDEDFSTVGVPNEEVGDSLVFDPARRNYRSELQAVTVDMENFVTMASKSLGGPSVEVFRAALSRSRNDTWYGAIPQGSLLAIFHRRYSQGTPIRSVRDIRNGTQPFVLPSSLNQLFGPIDFKALMNLSSKLTGETAVGGTHALAEEELKAAKSFCELTDSEFVFVDMGAGLVWPVF